MNLALFFYNQRKLMTFYSSILTWVVA